MRGDNGGEKDKNFESWSKSKRNSKGQEAGGDSVGIDGEKGTAKEIRLEGDGVGIDGEKSRSKEETFWMLEKRKSNNRRVGRERERLCQNYTPGSSEISF